MVLEIFILVTLLLFSGFFSASETALVSLSPAKVRELVQKKRRGSILVERLKSNPHKLLITILIGNNLVNILTSVYTTIVFQKLLGDAALGIITGALTLFILVFGDIIPKSFAQAHAKTISIIFSPVLYFFYIIFTPLAKVLDMLLQLFLKLFGRSGSESNVTEDELKAFVSIGAEEGAIERNEQELIENVLEFSDTRVEEIMVPRVEIQALPQTATLRDAADFIVEHHHSRIPVYEGTIDNVIGVITVKDVLSHVHRGELEKPLSTLKLLRPVKVPVSKKLNELFNEFQKRRMHLAIVLDEHGGTAGLITLEDVLEEIVGEIVDEFDEEEVPHLMKIGRMEVEATGKTPIFEINEALDIEIPWDNKSISYYITEKLGRFPKQGEILEEKNFTITVDQMDKLKIEKLTIERKS
ncbi:MAG: protein of unknown function DUF21 [uncultured bacterium]|nr:MAG: protein of unknown function DUF21 [uncultured bacterium]KKT74856.1 MAG: hypothetical protein UW70_C0044G0026 [Candidatus Peregrinibacteria bacterium GW2011_GWA2_44_7]